MIFIYLPGGHPRVFGRLRVFVGAVIETFRSTTENKVRKLAPHGFRRISTVTAKDQVCRVDNPDEGIERAQLVLTRRSLKQANNTCHRPVPSEEILHAY